MDLTQEQKLAIQACLRDDQTVEFAQAGFGFFVYAEWDLQLEQFTGLDQAYYISSVTREGDKVRVLFWPV